MRITVLLELSVIYKTLLNRKIKRKEEEREEVHEEDRRKERKRDSATSGVGDFIKNSCVWELLSEPRLPHQSLCCQPSSESTSGIEGE